MSNKRIKEVIYFVSYEDGPIKIGKTTDLLDRIKTLQTSTPFELKCLGVVPNTNDTESVLHRQFANIRMSGEWFERDETLLSFIASNCDAELLEASLSPLPAKKKREKKKLNRMIAQYSDERIKKAFDLFEEDLSFALFESSASLISAAIQLRKLLNDCDNLLIKNGLCAWTKEIDLEIRRVVDHALGTDWRQSVAVMDSDNIDRIKELSRKSLKRKLQTYGWYGG